MNADVAFFIGAACGLMLPAIPLWWHIKKVAAQSQALEACRKAHDRDQQMVYEMVQRLGHPTPACSTVSVSFGHDDPSKPLDLAF